MGPCGVLLLSSSHRVVYPLEELYLSSRWEPPTTRSDVPLRHNASWMSEQTCSRLPGVDQASKGFFPRWIARGDRRCDVDENMCPNAADRVDELYFYICSSPIQVCIVNMCSSVLIVLLECTVFVLLTDLIN